VIVESVPLNLRTTAKRELDVIKMNIVDQVNVRCGDGPFHQGAASALAESKKEFQWWMNKIMDTKDSIG